MAKFTMYLRAQDELYISKIVSGWADAKPPKIATFEWARKCNGVHVFAYRNRTTKLLTIKISGQRAQEFRDAISYVFETADHILTGWSEDGFQVNIGITQQNYTLQMQSENATWKVPGYWAMELTNVNYNDEESERVREHKEKLALTVHKAFLGDAEAMADIMGRIKEDSEWDGTPGPDVDGSMLSAAL